MDPKLQEYLRKTVDTLKTQGKSDDVIKVETKKVFDKYMELQQQSSKEITPSFFQSAKVEGTKSVEDYAQRSGQTASFPAPADSTNDPLGVIGRTAGNIPSSALHLLTGGIDFVGNAISHPIDTARSLIKDPSQIFGPAAQELAYGIQNAIEGGGLDSIQKGLSKSAIAFQNDPLFSFFGPKWAKETTVGLAKKVPGADAVKRTTEAIKSEGVSTGIDVAKREVKNQMTDILFDNPIVNFYSSLKKVYQESSQGWVLTQARNSAKNALDLMQREKSLETELSFVPEISSKLETQRAEYQTKMAEAEKLGKLTDEKRAEYQTKIQEAENNRLDIANKRAELSDIKSQIAERTKEIEGVAQDASARTEVGLIDKTYNGSASFKNAEELNKGITDFVSSSKEASDLLYNTSLKDANGMEIPVSPSNIVPKLMEFAETIKKTGDLELYKKYQKIAAGYMLKDLFNTYGNEKGVTNAIVKDKKISETIPEEWKTKDGYGLNTENPEVRFYMSPMYLNFIPLIRNNLKGVIAESKTGVKTFFTEQLNPVFEQTILDNIRDRNPELVNAYTEGKNLWSNARKLEDMQKENPVAFEKLIVNRWGEISQILPEVMREKVSDYYAKKILADARGINGYSATRLNTGLKNYREVIGTENVSTIEGLIDAFEKKKNMSLLVNKNIAEQNIRQLNENVLKSKEEALKLKEETQGLSQQAFSAEEQASLYENTLKQTEEAATKSGLSPETIVINISNIKDAAGLKEMTKATGRTAQELLNIYIQQGFKDIDFKPGSLKEGEGFSLENSNKLVNHLESLPTVLKDKMTKNQITIYEMFIDAAEKYSTAKKLSEKPVAARLLYALGATFSFAIGHPVIGAGLVGKSILPGKTPESINPRTAGKETKTKKSNKKKGPGLTSYIGTASQILNRQLTDEEKALLEDQYNQEFSD